jgi:hypothetical protein
VNYAMMLVVVMLVVAAAAAAAEVCQLCVTASAGLMLQRATQAAVTALWSTFQQLKFGSSKTVPKDGTRTRAFHSTAQPQFGSDLFVCAATVHEVTSLYVQRVHKMAALEKQVC